MKSTMAFTVAVAALSTLASACGGGSGGGSASPSSTAAQTPSETASAVLAATAASDAGSAPQAAASVAASAVAADTGATSQSLETTTGADSSTKSGSSTSISSGTSSTATTSGTGVTSGAGGGAAITIPGTAAPGVQTETAPPPQANAQQSSADFVAADFGTLTSRMRAEYLGISAWQADTAIPSLNAKGEWADIDYEDRSVGEWKPMAHLERVRAMAVVYSANSGKYAKATSVRDGVVRALRAWVARKPQSENWWHNTIGVQSALMPILVLMDADMPADLRSSLLATFVPFASVPADRKTGQNLIWYATQSIVKGALSRSSGEVAIGRDAMRSTLAITTGEGLQADLSFQQHGNQLYSGGYGLTYLTDMVRVANWLKGTAWTFSSADLNLLADYAIVGIGPLVRGDWIDWGARGREITRQESVVRPSLLRDPVNSLLTLAPDRHAGLLALSNRLATGAAPTEAGTTGYWRSDFLVHQTRKGYFSVKMVSKRTIGTESGNGENLLGYWLPFGTTFILSSGAEYLGLQPLLDWSALPGTTTPVDVVPSFTGYLRHPEEKIAVLSSGSNGLASMQVNTQGLQAKKFWFIDGEMMVGLGSDIRYSGSQRVRTTLNQTRWAGSATSSAGALSNSAEQNNIKWLVHEGVGYLALDGHAANVSVDERRLTGADPTTTSFAAKAATTKPTQLLTLSLDHGTKPQDAAYAYAVIHGVSTAAQAQAAPRPRVLANTAAIQGVMSADGARIAAVFHKSGTLTLRDGITLQADQPVAVLGQISGAQLQVQVVDLAGNGATVVLKTLKDGVAADQRTVTTLSNTQRTRQTPAATATLAIAK